MAEVSVIDYGLGNVQAFVHVYERLNIPVEAVRTPEALASAKRLILPGVGSFDWAMTRLEQSGLRAMTDTLIREQKRPVLGVCVGMQIMAEASEEGELPGLGWIEADVVSLSRETNAPLPLPHMGWNDIVTTRADQLFEGIEAPRYYFLHSFCMQPRNDEDVLATAGYGRQFAAAVRRDNVFGTQFHPEKSHQWGINLLRNFALL